jgi:hypothetical protein
MPRADPAIEAVAKSTLNLHRNDHGRFWVGKNVRTLAASRFDWKLIHPMSSNDKAERRAAAGRIAGHNSLCTFDPPCSAERFRVIARADC